MSAKDSIHVPVMVDEVLAALDPRPGQILVDGTAGGGGHLWRLVDAVSPEGWVLGIDRDPEAVGKLESRFAGQPVQLATGSYAELPAFMQAAGVAEVDGVLLDLGLSSDQLADRERGFSFNIDGPLDLRFNPETGESASRLINRLSVEHLANLIYEYGEERLSRRIARAIVATRKAKPIETAQQLGDLIRSVVPKRRSERIHPATRTFQALRIAVNDELGQLQTLLRKVGPCLSPGGKLAIISFHSLEDRLVKQAFQDLDRWELASRRPIRASEAEVVRNPRSRSAKLRVAARRVGI